MLRFLLLMSFVVAGGCGGGSAADRGMAAYQQGNHEQAIKYFNLAITKEPSNPAHYCNRGNSYSAMGMFDNALQDYERAFARARAQVKDPKDQRFAYIYFNRGVVFEKVKRYPEALADFEKALALDPQYPDARSYCAWIWATNSDPALRNPQKAVEYALAEMEIIGDKNPAKDAAITDTLAAAYAATGDFEKAVQTQQEAIQKITPLNNRAGYDNRLKLYQENQPYIDAAE